MNNLLLLHIYFLRVFFFWRIFGYLFWLAIVESLPVVRRAFPWPPLVSTSYFVPVHWSFRSDIINNNISKSILIFAFIFSYDFFDVSHIWTLGLDSVICSSSSQAVFIHPNHNLYADKSFYLCFYSHLDNVLKRVYIVVVGSSLLFCMHVRDGVVTLSSHPIYYKLIDFIVSRIIIISSWIFFFIVSLFSVTFGGEVSCWALHTSSSSAS